MTMLRPTLGPRLCGEAFELTPLAAKVLPILHKEACRIEFKPSPQPFIWADWVDGLSRAPPPTEMGPCLRAASAANDGGSQPRSSVSTEFLFVDWFCSAEKGLSNR